MSAPRFDLTTLGEGQLRLCVPAGERREGADRFDAYVSGTEGNVAVVILDRIGAGDAMVAGVLHGVLGGDFARGLHQGAVCAALSLGQYGDLPNVDVDELDRLVDAPGGLIER
jgi:sugar/nucleoside kinase (ribokinase family)